MDKSTEKVRAYRLTGMLENEDSAVRLRAALAAGTEPEDALVPVLVQRFDEEPDFFVRDMLTWALTRHPRDVTIPLLFEKLGSASPQARSQSLHTLSKIGEPVTWSAITDSMLTDKHDDVARAAWRAAVVLVPAGARAELAARMAGQLGRGAADVQRSLSRAFLELGDAAEEALDTAAVEGDQAVRAHARATLHLLDDPESGFGYALDEANRELALEFRRGEAG